MENSIKLFDVKDIFKIYGGVNDHPILEHIVNTENIREGSLFIGIQDQLNLSQIFMSSNKNIWFDEHDVLVFRNGQFLKLSTGEDCLGRFQFFVELACPSMSVIIKELIEKRLSISELRYKGNLGPALLSGNVSIYREKRLVTSNTFNDVIFSNGGLKDYIYSRDLDKDILAGSKDFHENYNELDHCNPLKNTILEDIMYQFDFEKVVDACKKLGFCYRDEPITKQDIVNDMIEILNGMFSVMEDLMKSNERFTAIQHQRGRLKGYLYLTGVEDLFSESEYDSESFYIIYDNKRWYFTLDLSFFIELSCS